MTKNLIGIDLELKELEMIVNCVTSNVDALIRAFPGIINDPDFNTFNGISMGLQRILEEEMLEAEKRVKKNLEKRLSDPNFIEKKKKIKKESKNND